MAVLFGLTTKFTMPGPMEFCGSVETEIHAGTSDIDQGQPAGVSTPNCPTPPIAGNAFPEELRTNVHPVVPTCSVYKLATAVPVASVTEILKVCVPSVVGVPVNRPAALNDNPDGSEFGIADHVYGGVPPVAATVKE
jgi:hypothetical protein